MMQCTNLSCKAREESAKLEHNILSDRKLKIHRVLSEYMADIDLDTRLLSDFIYSLNIARRQVTAYPSGHPMIAAAAEKLLALLEKVLEFRREVTLGIARDTLLLDGKQLDHTNPVYRDFA